MPGPGVLEPDTAVSTRTRGPTSAAAGTAPQGRQESSPINYLVGKQSLSANVAFENMSWILLFHFSGSQMWGHHRIVLKFLKNARKTHIGGSGLS